MNSIDMYTDWDVEKLIAEYARFREPFEDEDLEHYKQDLGQHLTLINYRMLVYCYFLLTE